MSETTRKPISEIAPEDLNQNLKLGVSHSGDIDEFIVTIVGGIWYAVNLKTGSAFTRPQLVHLYRRRLDAKFFSVTPRSLPRSSDTDVAPKPPKIGGVNEKPIGQRPSPPPAPPKPYQG